MNIGKSWQVAISLVVFAMITTGVNAQNMYKWVDAQGRVHYSDQPPPPDAREAHSLKRAGGPASLEESEADEDDDSAAKSYVEKEKEFQRRRAEKAEQETKAKELAKAEEERKRNCELARSNLQSASAGGRITRRNAQGELEYLDENDLDQARDRAQQAVNEWCGD